MAEKTNTMWQRKLLPLMVAAIVGASIFFGVVSVFQFGRLETSLTTTRSDVAKSLEDLSAFQPSSLDDQIRLTSLKASILLEEEALGRRHAEASGVIMLRAWTRFMGFITGMILAMIGASFILGKLQEDTTTVSGSGAGLTLSMASASPGLVLSIIGTILMGLSITNDI